MIDQLFWLIAVFVAIVTSIKHLQLCLGTARHTARAAIEFHLTVKRRLTGDRLHLRHHNGCCPMVWWWSCHLQCHFAGHNPHGLFAPKLINSLEHPAAIKEICFCRMFDHFLHPQTLSLEMLKRFSHITITYIYTLLYCWSKFCWTWCI